VITGLGEDPERAAQQIVARTAAPAVEDLFIEGSALVEHAPHKLPDLFAGAPVVVSIRSRPADGELVVRGSTASGPWESRVRVPPTQQGDGSQAIVALFGREVVEDLDVKLAASGDSSLVDAKVETIGLRYRIATRLTSWVAIAEVLPSIRASRLKRVRIPHLLPHGMSIEALGLRPAAGLDAGAPRLVPLGSPMFCNPQARAYAAPMAFALAMSARAKGKNPFAHPHEGQLDARVGSGGRGPARVPDRHVRARVRSHRNDRIVIEVVVAILCDRPARPQARGTPCRIELGCGRLQLVLGF
jgi:hypothetical protein